MYVWPVIMGLVHIPHELHPGRRNEAVLQLDGSDLERTVSLLQSAVGSLPDHPTLLAKLWSLADAAQTSRQQPVTILTPSAAALRQRLGVDVAQELDVGILTPDASSPISSALQPTPPGWFSTGGPSSSLALASRGFGQSLEQAFAGLGVTQQNAGGFTDTVPWTSDHSAWLQSQRSLEGSKFKSFPAPAVAPALSLQGKKSLSQGAVGKQVSAQDAAHLLQKTSLNTQGLQADASSAGVQRLRRLSVEMSPWKGCYTTSAAEHNNGKIGSLIYSPVVEGLSGDWGHKGWLISSSPKLLNLWECSQRLTGPPLQLMHSQAINSVVENMDIDMGAKLLLSVGSDAQAKGFFVTMHSLSPATFFQYKGMIRIPDRVAPELKKQLHGSVSKLVHVSSLQPFQGPLRSAVAVAVGAEVLVYELNAASTGDTAVAPTAFWKAHESVISCMHRSAFGCNLITGACDGSIRLWDLRNKPSVPARQFAQLKQVTGLTMLDANTLSSCGTDCSIQFWDLRTGDRAFSNVVPDGKPVLNMASACCSPNIISFTTRQSLYCLEFSGMPSLLSPLTPLPPAGPSTDLKWNTKSKQIYAAGIDGTISVFGKSSS